MKIKKILIATVLFSLALGSCDKRSENNITIDLSQVNPADDLFQKLNGDGTYMYLRQPTNDLLS